MDQKNKIENSTEAGINPQLNDYPIGYFVKEKGIHLGLGVYLDEDTHASLIADSTSPSMFVGNILLSVFKKSVLLVSTLTGRGTNRSISGKGSKLQKQKIIDNNEEEEFAEKIDDINSEEENEVHEANEDCDDYQESNKENKILKLDPKKINACKAYYTYWLEQYYEKELTKRQMKSYNRSQEIANFKEYVTKKISNLKQKQPSKKKQKSKRILDDPLSLDNVSASNLDYSNSFHLDAVLIETGNKDDDNIYDENLLVSSSDELESQ